MELLRLQKLEHCLDINLLDQSTDITSHVLGNGKFWGTSR